MLRAILNLQTAVSDRLDQLLPGDYRVDGNTEFACLIVPAHLANGLWICDVGGGQTPAIDPTAKQRLSLTVHGIDIDGDALRRAPAGSYDVQICADLTRYRGDGRADLAICRTVFEHVADTDLAFAGLASLLKAGGKALIFVPCRNAIFARLNLLLPERVKVWLLGAIFPETAHEQGFPAVYDRCTPRQFRELAERHGLALLELRTYWSCDYFRFCVPCHLLWRLWQQAARLVAGAQAAETFMMVVQRRC
jgi:2-polyprenyl-6-hydroxyphenyl methylase/3-demethylubiquinone-9 3-methyltransferase